MAASKIRIPEVDVAEVRHGLGLTVEEFADRFGLTRESVRKWEAGASAPYPLARVMLAIIASHPEVVDEVLAIPKAVRASRAFRDA